MSIVIITGDGPEHRYVANKLTSRFDVSRIFVCDSPPPRSWKATLKRSGREFAGKSLRRVYLKLIGDAAQRKASVQATLGPMSENFQAPHLLTHCGLPKDPLLEAEVARSQPEIIAVYGTGIVPDRVLQKAGFVALNMHTGLSPWYRGVSCFLWPLIDRRPDMVGATVHECTVEVDGGRIFYQARARLVQGDDIHAVFARAVIAGAEGYADVLSKALSQELEGTVQDMRIGREYTGRMLGVRAELAGRLALRRLAKSFPAQEG